MLRKAAIYCLAKINSCFKYVGLDFESPSPLPLIDICTVTEIPWYVGFSKISVACLKDGKRLALSWQIIIPKASWLFRFQTHCLVRQVGPTKYYFVPLNELNLLNTPIVNYFTFVFSWWFLNQHFHQTNKFLWKYFHELNMKVPICSHDKQLMPN